MIKEPSRLHALKYYIMVLAVVYTLYVYSLYTGWGLFNSTSSEKWKSSGQQINHK